tara:strand:- start:57 stop:275 length:219 start_codon:yes stop_codon:yes gene_type:complete
MTHKKFIISPENPNGIYVDLTAEEISEFEQRKIMEAELRQKQIDKKAKKLSGKQKLKDLGLDDDEIKALTGA